MLYYRINKKIPGEKFMKKSVRLVIYFAVACLLFAGGVFWGGRNGQKQTDSKEKTAPLFELVTPVPDVLEVKFLQMIINNEEPAMVFKGWDFVPLDKLPKIIQQEGKNYYIDCTEEERIAWVCRYDLDHDGQKEWIVQFRNNYGNSGNGYHIFSQYKGKLQCSGGVFGLVICPISCSGRHGIFQKYHMGGSERIYTFYELVNGKLSEAVEINLKRHFLEKGANLTLSLKAKSEYTFDDWF